MALDGVDGGCSLGKNFVIGPDDTRATDDFLLCNRLLVASEALLYYKVNGTSIGREQMKVWMY